MKSLQSLIVLSIIAIATNSFALGLGAHIGFGVQFPSQFGIDYMPSNSWNFNLGYSLAAADKTKTVQASIAMPEFSIHWHPGGKGFFLGVGGGTVTYSGKNKNTGLELETVSSAVLGKVGFVVQAKKGFWWSIDASSITPSKPKTTLKTTLSETDPNYISTVNSANTLGETAFTEIAFHAGYRF